MCLPASGVVTPLHDVFVWACAQVIPCLEAALVRKGEPKLTEVERRYIRFCLLSLRPVCEPNSRWIVVFYY